MLELSAHDAAKIPTTRRRMATKKLRERKIKDFFIRAKASEPGTFCAFCAFLRLRPPENCREKAQKTQNTKSLQPSQSFRAPTFALFAPFCGSKITVLAVTVRIF